MSGSCQENRFTRAFLEESEPHLVVKGADGKIVGEWHKHPT